MSNTYTVVDTVTRETASHLEQTDVTLAYDERDGDRVAYVLEERDDD